MRRSPKNKVNASAENGRRLGVKRLTFSTFCRRRAIYLIVDDHHAISGPGSGQRQISVADILENPGAIALKRVAIPAATRLLKANNGARWYFASIERGQHHLIGTIRVHRCNTDRWALHRR